MGHGIVFAAFTGFAPFLRVPGHGLIMKNTVPEGPLTGAFPFKASREYPVICWPYHFKMKKTGFLFYCIIAILQLGAQQTTFRPGMKISKPARFTKSIYHLAGNADTAKPILVIEGKNIVVDFGGSEIRGDTKGESPDRYRGVAILVRNAERVTIKNLKARGYKLALIARNCRDLVIENCDFSYNYRPRLNSTQEKEDISDWLSYHHNDNDEWLRYGAALYLKDCIGFTVRNCRVTGGQNALLLMRCVNGQVYNNDFSFNSGLGIGMYRSSGNRILFNRLNFNVRGYSHGVYNRGQDSAGILVYEQSQNNLFYKNSVTHSGDGFFLWAGQYTMDTGKGGCNGNEIIGNDFSYAPTNGVEVTFSRVRVSGNRIEECDHGIWGGYSYQSIFAGNSFRNNRIGIAIEHGQRNQITGNNFTGDRESVRLWSRKQQPADWGYAKYRDTRSVDYIIGSNLFNRSPLALNITGTDSVRIFENRMVECGLGLQKDSALRQLDSIGIELKDTAISLPEIKGAIDPFQGNETRAGRRQIMVTEWGPYDFRYPLIWNTNPVDTGLQMQFDLLGPKGQWQVRSVKGLKNLSASQGRFPGVLTADRLPGPGTDIEIVMEYRGGAFTDPQGQPVAAGKSHLFRFRKFFQPVDWQVLFYSLDTAAHNPIRTGSLFSPVERKVPVRTEQKDRLDYAWWGGIKAGDQLYPQFMTLAEGKAVFEPGTYEISVTWDDAVRVYLDQGLILDEWNPSNYSFDESPNRKIRLKLSGVHQFRVEHLELGGFACLALKINKVY